MRKGFVKILSVLLALLFVLCACSNTGEQTDVTTDGVVGSTDNQTEATTSENITTENITTQSGSETEAITTSGIYIERPDKEIKNILMIGNSFCYYYTEELYGIAAADGYQLNVANLYESGCPVADHWAWWNGGQKNYDLRLVSSSTNGVVETIGGKTDFQSALDYAKATWGSDWDVITLQQHFYPSMALSYDKCLQGASFYAKKLFTRLKDEHANSIFFWHQTWAYEVGYAVPDKYVGTPKSDTPIPDVETQTKTYENIKKASQTIAQANKVNLIPCGDAWQVARADSRVGDTMCKRLGTNGGLGDYYHDGDVGGGQYLNACVWYEVLMGKSCIGNTWRPSYELSEEKITALQEAAHAAVAALYGPGYAE